jgi:ABC-type bacteriocin/lantibiotic exporter with double-glycine peptidase domain
MNVYSFALTANSKSTLYWLAAGAIIIAVIEFTLKRERVAILNTSGKDLACHISYSVLSKLLWLPYSMTASAGTSSQLARLKDIDQFRQLVTTESSLSYFDLPFIIIFIVAIVVMSGTAAITVLAGILGMIIFSFYGRYIYSQATSKSSRANAMVSYQWNEVLSNTGTIQGLPLVTVLKSRFNAALTQRLNDADAVSETNTKIQGLGGSLIQVIGATSIVVAVLGVMSGNTDPGAMLALIILVWKALTPIMGIYNSLAKIDTIKASTAQINALMSLDDDSTKMEKSPPLNQFYGAINVAGLSHRYPGIAIGLTNLSFKLTPGNKLSVCVPSGCGKTTLLNLLSGIDMHFQGSIAYDGYNINQFNNFRLRNSINYIPYNIHLYHGSIQANYTIYNGYVEPEFIEEMLEFFDLKQFFPKGKDDLITSEVLNQLPDGIHRKLNIAIALGNCKSKVIIIDEPFAGCEKENGHYLTKLFTEKLKHNTVIYTTNEKSMIATSDFCLLLDAESAQKFFGTPDKVLMANPDIIY